MGNLYFLGRQENKKSLSSYYKPLRDFTEYRGTDSNRRPPSYESDALTN